jgi:hypothetical protein
MNQKPLNPITAQDIAQFQTDGVVCLRGMFDQEWITRMQKAVDRIMDAHNPLARPREVTQALGGTSGLTVADGATLSSADFKSGATLTLAPPAASRRRSVYDANGRLLGYEEPAAADARAERRGSPGPRSDGVCERR